MQLLLLIHNFLKAGEPQRAITNGLRQHLFEVTKIKCDQECQWHATMAAGRPIARSLKWGSGEHKK